MTSALRTFGVGGVLGIGIVSGGALAFAQTSGTTAPSADAPGTTTTPPGTDAPTTAAPSTGPGTTVPPTTGGTAPDGTAPTAPGKPDAPGKAGPHGKGGRGGHGHGGGRLLGRLGAGEQQLATELGVTVDQLKEAQKAAFQAVEDLGRPSKPATRPPSDEDKAKLEAELKARVDLFNT